MSEKCSRCNGLGYRTIHACIRLCEECGAFLTDELAFKAWIEAQFLPQFEQWRRAKRNERQDPKTFKEVDDKIIRTYRLYRNTNIYLNKTSRAFEWAEKRAIMEEFAKTMYTLNETEPVAPGGPVVIPDEET
jgi:hypothetical protein